MKSWTFLQKHTSIRVSTHYSLMDLKIIIPIIAIQFVISWKTCIMADLSLSREADLQLERQLKTLNKPAIKTFKV